jgi:putative two-component system response regulator
MVEKRTSELALTQEVTLKSLATLAEYRDPETGGHIKRTQNYVKLLSQHLKDSGRYNGFFTDYYISLLHRSAPLHDIGKVGICDSILLKPGKLTVEEFEQMKKHTTYGLNALKVSEQEMGESSFLRLAGEVANSHHERWDGSGYPFGLKGEEIPISGRIMAIADVYDALISKRVYKSPMPHKQAVEIILASKGSHFDPNMVDTFEEIEDSFRMIALEFADFEQEREMLINKE